MDYVLVIGRHLYTQLAHAHHGTRLLALLPASLRLALVGGDDGDPGQLGRLLLLLVLLLGAHLITTNC